MTEEDHNLMISAGAVEHSLDTEIQDAFIFGEMLKHFDINV